jgi:hypothetical protein
MMAGVESGPTAHGGIAAIGAGDPAGADEAIVSEDAVRGDTGNANTPRQADAGLDRVVNHQLM